MELRIHHIHGGVPLESVGVSLESNIYLLIPDIHLVYGAKYYTKLSTHHTNVVGVPLESMRCL